jgi:RNA polymerase subunit RPABC4/transcription elongation factor Spt4
MKKAYCNICGYETNQDEDGCVYHQRVKTTEDGEVYFKYDEFNQDGEEW